MIDTKLINVNQNKAKFNILGIEFFYGFQKMGFNSCTKITLQIGLRGIIMAKPFIIQPLKMKAL